LQGTFNAQIDIPSATQAKINKIKFVLNYFINVTAIVSIIITKEI
jgi:hypothetical protein